jgi:hypothetical protein
VGHVGTLRTLLDMPRRLYQETGCGVDCRNRGIICDIES